MKPKTPDQQVDRKVLAARANFLGRMENKRLRAAQKDPAWAARRAVRIAAEKVRQQVEAENRAAAASEPSLLATAISKE